MKLSRFKSCFFLCTGSVVVLLLVLLVGKPRLYEEVREALLEYSYKFEDDQFHTSKEFKCDGKWTKWYKEYHQNSLQSTDKNRKFLIFYCAGHENGCGGYGNRMVGIISTFYLAVLLGRTFMIHWGGPEKLSIFLQPNEIDWTYDDTKFRDLKSRSYYWGTYRPGGYDRYKRHSEESFMKWVRTTNLNAVLDQPVEKLETIWYFAESLWGNQYVKARAKELELPSFQLDRPFAMIGCAMKFLFKKSRYLMKEFGKVKTVLDKRERPLIGIHIRTSDHHWGSTNKHSYRTNVPKRVFLCAERVEQAFKKKYVSLRKKTFTWFLAADDKNLKQTALRDYPKHLITLDIVPLHLDLNGAGFQGILQDLLMDQLMLLECDYFLPTRDSTFSYMVIGMRQYSAKSYVFGEHCPLDESAVALAPAME